MYRFHWNITNTLCRLLTTVGASVCYSSYSQPQIFLLRENSDGKRKDGGVYIRLDRPSVYMYTCRKMCFDFSREKKNQYHFKLFFTISLDWGGESSAFAYLFPSQYIHTRGVHPTRTDQCVNNGRPSGHKATFVIVATHVYTSKLDEIQFSSSFLPVLAFFLFLFISLFISFPWPLQISTLQTHSLHLPD